MEVDADVTRGRRLKERDFKSLEKRIQKEASQPDVARRRDGHQMTYSATKSKRQKFLELKSKQHMEERKAVRRSTNNLRFKKGKPFMWIQLPGLYNLLAGKPSWSITDHSLSRYQNMIEKDSHFNRKGNRA